LKTALKLLIETSLSEIEAQKPEKISIELERTRQQSHGDFSCNIAMVLAKQLGTNPRQLARNS